MRILLLLAALFVAACVGDVIVLGERQMRPGDRDCNVRVRTLDGTVSVQRRYCGYQEGDTIHIGW